MDRLFTIGLEPLRRAINTAAIALPPVRRPLPILQCAMLSAAEGRAALEVTDLQVWLRLDLPEAEIAAGGQIAVPLGPVQQMLQPLGGDAVIAVEVEGERAVLSGPRWQASMIPCPAEDLQFAPTPPDEGAVVTAGDLLALLAGTENAASFEETRYYLNGVLLQEWEGMLRAVATDGHRMHIHDLRAWHRLAPDEATANTIVPRDAVRILRHLVSGLWPDTLVRYRTSGQPDNVFSFEAPGWRLAGKAIDGTFPDYWRVVPKPDPDPSVEARRPVLEIRDRHAFAQAVAVIAGLGSDRSRPLAIRQGEGGLVEVTAEDAEVGMVVSVLPATAAEWRIRGDAGLRIGFQCRYIQAVLDALPEGVITAQLGATDLTNHPVIFRAGAGCAVVMPMRWGNGEGRG